MLYSFYEYLLQKYHEKFPKDVDIIILLISSFLFKTNKIFFTINLYFKALKLKKDFF